jgi:hypothetical protein
MAFADAVLDFRDQMGKTIEFPIEPWNREAKEKFTLQYSEQAVRIEKETAQKKTSSERLLDGGFLKAGLSLPIDTIIKQITPSSGATDTNLTEDKYVCDITSNEQPRKMRPLEEKIYATTKEFKNLEAQIEQVINGNCEVNSTLIAQVNSLSEKAGDLLPSLQEMWENEEYYCKGHGLH